MTPSILHLCLCVTGGLGAYQTRYQENFQWGTSRQSTDVAMPPPRAPEENQPKTALIEEDDTDGLWAEGATADMMF